MSNIKAIRGMNDILPDETPYWQYLERTVGRLLRSYGYGEIRLPVAYQRYSSPRRYAFPVDRRHRSTRQR